jgi:CDP-diacylglycerol--glycerol-3-phosphate 3-phosphatidyltransferase
MNIFTPSNFLSFLRIPLAFVLISDNTLFRFLAIGLAMLTDGLDGYVARRYRMISRVGTFLDPFTDKFFVLFAISIFMHEGYLHLGQAIALLSRDIAVLLFGCYLKIKGNWSRFSIQSFWCGKITTFLQFLVLLAFSFHYHIPAYAFIFFVFLGVMSLFELYYIEQQQISNL